MAVFMISYDIKVQENFEYPKLYEAIKKIGSWCPVLESVWYVDTVDYSATDIYDYLHPYLTLQKKGGDTLIVQRCHISNRGWLNVDVVAWLESPDRTWSKY